MNKTERADKACGEDDGMRCGLYESDDVDQQEMSKQQRPPLPASLALVIAILPSER